MNGILLKLVKSPRESWTVDDDVLRQLAESHGDGDGFILSKDVRQSCLAILKVERGGG